LSTPLKPLGVRSLGLFGSDTELPPDLIADSPLMVNCSLRKGSHTVTKKALGDINQELQSIMRNDFTELDMHGAGPLFPSGAVDNRNTDQSVILFQNIADEARREVGRKMSNRWLLSARKLDNSIEKARGEFMEATNDAYEDVYRRMDESVSEFIQDIHAAIHKLIRSADGSFEVENGIKRQLQVIHDWP
jgi:hypothetical protein